MSARRAWTMEELEAARDAAECLLTPVKLRPDVGIRGTHDWMVARVEWHRRYGDAAVADVLATELTELARLSGAESEPHERQRRSHDP